MKNKPLDVVYILGTGSKWYDNELRYSLRSLERYYPHNKVFIIGERPSWLQNVIHIKGYDKFSVKTQNGVNKIMQAARDPRISSDFVLMNDDFYFLKPVNRIEYYTRGTVEEMLAKHKTKTGYYYKMLQETNAQLKKMGIEVPVDFEVHYPVIFNKEKLLKTAAMVGQGYDLLGLRTLYGNLMEISGRKVMDFKAQNLAEFSYQQKRNVGLMSSSDTLVIAQEFRDWIRAKFDGLSMYENDNGNGTTKRPGNRRKLYYCIEDFNHNGTLYQNGDIVPADIVAMVKNSKALADHIELR